MTIRGEFITPVEGNMLDQRLMSLNKVELPTDDEWQQVKSPNKIIYFRGGKYTLDRLTKYKFESENGIGKQKITSRQRPKSKCLKDSASKKQSASGKLYDFLFSFNTPIDKKDNPEDKKKTGSNSSETDVSNTSDADISFDSINSIDRNINRNKIKFNTPTKNQQLVNDDIGQVSPIEEDGMESQRHLSIDDNMSDAPIDQKNNQNSTSIRFDELEGLLIVNTSVVKIKKYNRMEEYEKVYLNNSNHKKTTDPNNIDNEDDEDAFYSINPSHVPSDEFYRAVSNAIKTKY